MSLTLDVVYQGLPYNETSAVETLTLDIVYQGVPYTGLYSAPQTSYIPNLLMLFFNF